MGCGKSEQRKGFFDQARIRDLGINMSGWVYTGTAGVENINTYLLHHMVLSLPSSDRVWEDKRGREWFANEVLVIT